MPVIQVSQDSQLVGWIAGWLAAWLRATSPEKSFAVSGLPESNLYL